MPSSTVENYLKQILIVTLDENCSKVPMGKVATELSVTPGTATSMAKIWSGMDGLLSRRGVALTRKGRKVAMNMLRRHRLLETFLVEALDLDWSEIHAEAEVGACDFRKGVGKVGPVPRPTRYDPHGHPIPSKGG